MLYRKITLARVCLPHQAVRGRGFDLVGYAHLGYVDGRFLMLRSALLHRASIVATAVLVAVGSACAGVTAIGEFTGTLSEGFENVAPPGGQPTPLVVLNGMATMDDQLAHFNVIAFSWQGPSGSFGPYNGNLFEGSVAGSTLVTFNTPMSQFGGFFTTSGTLSNGQAIFRDAGGAIIDTVPMSITPVEWNWQGWSSTTPFTSVELVSANSPGIGMQADDLQVTVAPEPASIALVGLGAVALARRARHARRSK
jgi:hypothetical protein